MSFLLQVITEVGTSLFLAKSIYVLSEACCCCSSVNSPVCALSCYFLHQLSVISFTGFILWHHVLNLLPVFSSNTACSCEKGKAAFVVAPQGLFPAVFTEEWCCWRISSLSSPCAASIWCKLWSELFNWMGDATLLNHFKGKRRTKF